MPKLVKKEEYKFPDWEEFILASLGCIVALGVFGLVNLLVYTVGGFIGLLCLYALIVAGVALAYGITCYEVK